MRNKIIAAVVFAVMSALMFSAPVAAQGPPEAGTHPFCGSGQEFAYSHIVSLAQEQGLGEAHGHNPGGHQGFAVCDPAGRF